MKLLLTNHYDLMLSENALLKARKLGAPWADKKYMPMPKELDREEYIFYSESLDMENERQHVFFNFDDGEKELYCAPHNLPRNDIYLLKLFEEMGGDLSDGTRHFFLVDVPDDIRYHISFSNSNVEIVTESYRIWNHKGECIAFPDYSKYSTWMPY